MLAFCVFAVLARSVSGSGSFLLEHSLDGGNTFRPRTSFQHSSGDITITPRAEDSVMKEEIEAFKALLASNDLYMLKIHSQGDNSSSVAVRSAIPACELQKSNFKEDIALHFDRVGNIVGMHYTSPVVALSRHCNPKKIANDMGINFQTKIHVVEPVTAQVIPAKEKGPRPPTLANVKLNVDDVAENSKPEANQSFLRKYWYIVLPMVLFTLFGGGEPPQEGGSGNAQAKGSSSAPVSK